MQDDTTTTVHVALGVHKDSIVAAYSVGLGEVQTLGSVGDLERDITKLCARMQSKDSRVSFVHEAGPTGYGLYRRNKIDRADAAGLLEADRCGDIRPVLVKTPRVAPLQSPSGVSVPDPDKPITMLVLVTA